MAVMFDSPLPGRGEQRALLAELVGALESAERMVSAAAAARDGLLAIASHLAHEVAEAEGGDDPSSLVPRTVATEIAAALRMSDRTVEHRMGEALRLVEDFPRTYGAQSQGRIAPAHTRIILDEGAGISVPAAREAYESEVLAFAEAESPGRLRRFARRAAERFRERSIAERHGIARGLRRVSLVPLEDGMASLGAVLPAVVAHGIYDRLSQMAFAVKTANGRAAKGEAVASGVARLDERNVDELRADLLAEMLLTAVPAAHDSEDALLGEIAARVEVSVPVLTLMGEGEGIDRGAAELNGTQPIDTRTARILAGEASGWDRVLTHPVAGTFLGVDRYRPSEQLRRHLRARDQRCRFPGCTVRARHCDIDHNHDAALGGATEEKNLADFCRRHHVVKHQTPWRVRQLGGGLIEWASPTGRVYIDTPPPVNAVTFTPFPHPAEFAIAPF